MKHTNTITTKTSKIKSSILSKTPSAATKSPAILRVETISLIKSTISDCRGGRCVIALVGRTGSGKSTAISQLRQSLSEEVTIYDPLQYDSDVPPLGKLRGISIIENPWQYPNVKDAIIESSKSDRHSVIIVVCMDIEDVREVCGDILTTIIPIEHWKCLTNG